MPPSRPWALVTPASRGIGRALARTLLQTTRVPVVATARGSLDKARNGILCNLQGGGDDPDKRLKVVKLDFLQEGSISTAAAKCKELFPAGDQDQRWHLHLAYCIPGILFPEKAPSQIDAAQALRTMQTNVLGPLLAIKHFAPFLPRKMTQFDQHEHRHELDGLPPSHAVWAIMSARVGSTQDNRLGGWYSYRASKAAVNQLAKTFDHHLNMQSGGTAIAVALHPGTVKTELSREFWAGVEEGQLLSPEESAKRLCEVVRGLGGDARGKCWDHRGEEVPP